MDEDDDLVAVYNSGITTIPEDVKEFLVFECEKELFDSLTDEEKADVFNMFDVESTVTVAVSLTAPVSSARLVARALETSIPHMPEATRDSVRAMADFYVSIAHTAMKEFTNP
jgi:chorismate mutase